MRIALVELYEHQEVLAYLLKVLGGAAELQVFASPFVVGTTLEEATFASANTVRIALKERSTFTQRYRSQLAKADVIMVVTQSVDPRPFAGLHDLGVPTVLVVHDGNFCFARSPVYSQRPADIIRRLHWRLRGWWNGSRNSIRGYSGYVSSRQTAFFGGSRILLAGANTLVTPFALAAAKTSTPPQETNARAPLQIAIPGTLDARRRDFAPVLGALTYLRRPYQLRLPGATATGSKTWLHKLQQLPGWQTCEPNTYDAVLAASDLMLVPLRLDVYYATGLERYGETKNSGAEHDQIRHQKPGFYPIGYVGAPALAAWQTHYANAESLLQSLESWQDPAAAFPTAFELPPQQAAWLAFLAGVAAN